MVAACGLVWDPDGAMAWAEGVRMCVYVEMLTMTAAIVGLGSESGSGSSCRSATHIEIITPTRRNFSAAAVVANNKPGDSNSCSRGINTRRRPF